MNLEKLRKEIVKFVAEKYREEGSVPSVKRIINEFNLKSPSKLCKIFPRLQKQICREAGVPYPIERLKLVESALKARKHSAERLERGDFNFDFERSELEAKIKEFKYTFNAETESVKDEPYWRARREQFNHLCDLMSKRLKEVEEPKALKAIYRGFQKLKEHYMNIVGGITLSDEIEEERRLLAQLEGRRMEFERWQSCLEKRYGVPLEKIYPVVAELATAKERFGLAAEQVEATGKFVSVMVKAGWKPETLTWYMHEHFQTLLDIDSLRSEKQRLEREIRELSRRRNETLTEISDLKAEKRRIAEEAHALKVVRNTTAKTLNREMELIGKAKVNNILLGKMYKEGADALASAILNDQRFQVMLMKAVANQSLAEQAKTVVEIVKEKVNQIKIEATKLSLIAEMVQSQIKGNTSRSNNEGDREKCPTLSELLGPRIFKTLASDKYLGPTYI
jgi:hypothetical protein